MLAALAAGAAAAQTAPAAPLRICIFSKHLQWAGWQEAAEAARQMGFDGVDLTVRAGGHVLPERVEQDLPKAVAAVKAAGLQTPMITAGIVDAQSPHAEAILATAAGLGIRRYRWGGFTYTLDRDLPAQLEALKPRVAGLAELNAKHGVCAMYHIHSGPREVGAGVWDIWMLIKDHDPRWLGINYDIGHAVVEGGYGGWVHTSRLVRRHLRGVALKDFRWRRNAKGAWIPEWCPAGQGQVDFAAFFSVLQSEGFDGPVQVHYEYPLGGANDGKRSLTLPKSQVLAAMRQDLDYFKSRLRAAGLV